MAKKRNRSHRPPQAPPASREVMARARAKLPRPPTAPEAPSELPPGPPPRKLSSKLLAPGKPPPARARAGKLPPARPPVFWFGFELPWAKVCAARIVLFGLLAIDAFLQLRHAPRYGAGDFNVAHLSLLSDLGPGRAGYEAGQLALAYLFALAALGVATRLVLPISAALYAWLYLGSQLDSYQHHYLVALVVAIACFVPWQRPPDAAPGTPVRSWALRLILVQLGIMYLWAAISKLDPAWTSGATLGGILTGSIRSFTERTVGMPAASVAVIGAELVLACTIWLRPGWKLAAPLGILFHLGIAASGLEIGVFAYLMLGLYLLVLPDSLLVWLAETPALQAIRRPLHQLAAATSRWLWAIAVGAGLGIAALVPLEHPVDVAIAASAIPVGLAVRAHLRGRAPAASIALAHVAAILLWLAADRTTTVAVDYYKFWAGSQRRLGNIETAERAYGRLVEVAPDLELGHYYLGRILTGSGRGDEGVRHLQEAQRLAPDRARAFIEEARHLAAQGQRDEAIATARRATAIEPGNRDARALLDSLLANQTAPAGPAEDDEQP